MIDLIDFDRLWSISIDKYKIGNTINDVWREKRVQLPRKDAKAPRGKKHVNPRERFSDVEIVTLDSVYVKSKGKLSKAVMETTAKALKLDERQVSESRWKLYNVYTL